MKFSIARFAKSKFFIPGIVIGLVVLGWLVLLIAELGPFGNEKEVSSTPTTWSQKEDYVIKETPEGKFVINEKAGLSFKVPEGWRVEMDEFAGETGVVGFLEKTAKLDPQYGFLVEGCAIELAINYDEILTKNTQRTISYLEQHPEEDESDMFLEVIELDHYKALKEIGQVNPKFGKLIRIEIPLEKKLCYISTRLFLEEEKKCSHEFDKFLETVLIK